MRVFCGVLAVLAWVLLLWVAFSWYGCSGSGDIISEVLEGQKRV